MLDQGHGLMLVAGLALDALALDAAGFGKVLGLARQAIDDIFADHHAAAIRAASMALSSNLDPARMLLLKRRSQMSRPK